MVESLPVDRFDSHLSAFNFFSLIGVYCVLPGSPSDWDFTDPLIQICYYDTQWLLWAIITICNYASDEDFVRYQPPLPAGQLKVPTKFEHGGDGSPIAIGRGHVVEGKEKI